MKKLIISYIFLIAFLNVGFTQSFDYGNSWYRDGANQTFIKLEVEEDGVYRITTEELLSAGYDLSGVNPSTLKIIYRNREIPIFLRTSASGQFEALEFIGFRNDGRVDSIMYRDPITGLHKPDLQPNKNLSLFSDVSAYFLTWSNNPGKRMIAFFDVLYDNYEPEPSFSYTSLIEYRPGDRHTQYIRGGAGSFNSFFTLNSDYVTGEGYNGIAIQLGRPVIVEVPTPGAANLPGKNPIVKARIFNRSDTQHILRVEMNGNEDTPVLDTLLASNRVFIKTYTREYPTELSNITDLKFYALKEDTDNNNLCWTSVTYDRLPDFEGDSVMRITGFEKDLPAYFRFTNLNGSDSIYVFDLNNPIRAKGIILNNGEEARVIVPAFSNKRDLFVVTEKGFKTPRIVPHSLNRLFDPNQGAEFVIITNRSLKNSAEAYAQYRDTATVNPLTAKIVYTDEIFDEYGYGSITSWAIKRFCKDALDNWQIKPKYFLLWGKGAFLTRNEPLLKVPTFGYPATDHEFISHFDQNSSNLNPEAAIGRVNINNDQEGFIYLDKVNKYEHSTWDRWMKQGVFLGGGGNIGEQNSISNTFLSLLNVFEDNPYGGNGIYFQKRTASIIDPTNAAYHEEISSGVSVIHFFGHSTSNILDISIREANEYQNLGRFPFMIAMGCYGGDFTVSSSFGERWVLAENRGSIGYLGNSSAGYLPPLRNYARIFYEVQYDEGIGLPIGETVRRTIVKYMDSLNNLVNRNHARQLNLQGDPSISLYNVDLPDYELVSSNIFFTPDNFTAQDDSFSINIIVNNIGRAVKDSFSISIQQRFPNGRIFEHPSFKVPSTTFIDTFSTVLVNPFGNEATGQNIFEIFVDADEAITEIDERNNRIVLNQTVPGNKPATLFPTPFAIISDNTVHLDASSFFVSQEDDIGYVFEIDTTADFSSPSRISSGAIRGSANYISWDVPFTLQDSVVYFWRVRLSDVTPSIWSNSSFTYIKDKTGWSQSNFSQFEENTLTNLEADALQRRWTFRPIIREFEFRSRLGGSFTLTSNSGSNVFDFQVAGFTRNGLAYAIIEEDVSQYSPENNLVARYVSVDDFYIIRNAILNMKDGDYIMIASNVNPEIPSWSEDIFESLKLVGISDDIRYLNDGDGFVVLGRKGFPNSAEEILTPNSGNNYILRKEFSIPMTEGEIFSGKIGPAKSWDKIVWDWRSIDRIADENLSLEISVTNKEDIDSLYLVVNDNTKQTDLSSLDASNYPYLNFRLSIQDSINRTPPQLRKWQVFYEPVPDAVVDPISDFSFQSDTLFEGQTGSISLKANNITPSNMDSLLVKFSLERQDRTTVVLDSIRVAPLLANSSTDISFSYPTLENKLEGNVNLIVEINPNLDQPEQYLFNNTYIQPFYVEVDQSNPVLDVTFDGKYIINGDIVSSDPEILIQVNDENPYIPITDSNSVEIYLRQGNIVNPFERIFFSDPRIEWQPATLPDNKARMYFYPGQGAGLPDGDYALRIQAKDQKGNLSGENESFYEINFEVVNETAITHVLNYPNPFSTSTRFVYTLTGNELPEVFQIQIYTVSGRQVRVIDLVELGDAKLGRHITDFSWDGTDEFGDRLDNGVYLYRVVIKMPNEELLHREEPIDQFFKNGWGKLYILR